MIGLFIGVLSYYIIEHDIVARAQSEVTRAIDSARTIYQNQIEEIKNSLELTNSSQDLLKLKNILGIDYAYELSLEQKDLVESDIVRKAFEGNEAGGTRIIENEELSRIVPLMVDNLKIEIKDTLKAKPTTAKTLTNVLAIEYALPVINKDNQVISVRCAGKVISKDYNLVDKIRNLVFENRLYKNKPIGTVTIFQDDVRVATNVLDRNNQRAIGTRVSEEVYNRVLNNGLSWRDKAFVVTDWYLTAYEPIKSIGGQILGILYVGILEKPFVDLKIRIFFLVLTIVIFISFLAVILSYFFLMSISKPVKKLLEAEDKISEGNLFFRINEQTTVEEFNHLIDSFNKMAEKLKQREDSLRVAKEKGETLNKRYLDLVGFVSHEFKGILSSVILNTYSLRQGILGNINEAQEKTLKSMARNLDYLAVTVKNFLSLSRIEKEEMHVDRNKILVKENIFDTSADAFMQQAKDKDMKVVNNIESGLEVMADAGLMQVVANNLLNNAVKYGKEGGSIILSSRRYENIVEIEVYNDGMPIAIVDLDKLFKRFSRILYRSQENIKGSGIGLFITKEIIQKHGGNIWVEPKPQGNSFKFTLNLVA